MSSSRRFPLEFALIDRVDDEAVWTLIDGLAKNQKEHPENYGQIERELEWVDVTHFKSPQGSPSQEEKWLHRTVRDLQSSSNGIPAKTYVIPFRVSLLGEVVNYKGNPPDVYFIQVYGAEPYPMNFLRDEHILAQSYYSLKLAERPDARRENLRLKLESRIDVNSKRLLETFDSEHRRRLENSIGYLERNLKFLYPSP